MAMGFTASEIFEIAEQIERSGAKYYHDAATMCVDKSMRQFFSQLEEMEKNHEKIFIEMRKNLDEQTDDATVFDPDNEMAYYLKATAKSAGWEGKVLPQAEFSGHETPIQIIKTAIEAERASINYYLGLKEFVAAKDEEKLDKIIKEEMGHIVTLQKHLEQLK